VYPSSGDDEWVAIAVMDDEAWQRLCATVGWAPDRDFATAAARIAARADIDERLATWTAERSNVEAAEMLQANRVSAMPVMGPRDQHADPHLLQRGAIVQLVHPEVGDERHVGNPLRLSRLPQRTAASAPCLGADTEAVLTTVLGLTSDDVSALVDEGVCR
jgi:crotonobetainyl-CoA:carnitine CoA-transferase CaiB-like acyl-CoA transferase